MSVKNVALIAAAFLFLAGCSDDVEKKAATQVVAKVNGEEITVHQLNQILSGKRIPPSVSEDDIKSKALQALIDQTLVLQAAKNVKLDRDPVILSAIEEAKRKVLTDAYMKKTIGMPEQASLSEIQALYLERPELFSERKIFIYTKLAARVDDSELDAVFDRIKKVENYAELVVLLKEMNIPFEAMKESKSIESIQAPLRAPLIRLAVDDIGLMKVKGGFIALVMQQKIDQPVTLEQAKPVIEREIALRKQKESSVKLMESLRGQALVEYVGDIKPVDK